MANYRLTFEIQSPRTITGTKLHDIYGQVERYLRTVVLPKDNSAQATITTAAELDYEVHAHDGTNRCSGCRHLAEDQRD